MVVNQAKLKSLTFITESPPCCAFYIVYNFDMAKNISLLVLSFNVFFFFKELSYFKE